MLSRLKEFLFGSRVTARLNTIALVGDLDEVDLVRDVEQSFGIKLDPSELKSVVTMGQFEEIVRAETQDREFDAVWTMLEHIARAHTRKRDPIDRDTTFIAKFAQPREIQENG